MGIEYLTIRASEYPDIIDILNQAADKRKQMPNHDPNPTQTARDLLLVAATACVKYPNHWDNFQRMILDFEQEGKKKTG